ncbi:ABC transporter [Citrobacter koseri]|nr:ABC transporter [Citrobacter koseri]
MHTFTLKRVLGFTGAIALVLALLVWGVGLETIKARQVDLLYLGKQHLLLVFTSMFFALVIGIPSGILLSRPAAKGFAEYVMQLFNVGNTLPPLAVLALAMVIIGIGDVPAIFALFLASLLPVVRNTYAGLCSVPASLIEAANGIGMTKWQRLRQVELPNAWPVMLAGIRIATAINVGTAPLAFLIGGQQLRRADFPRHLPQ